MARMKAAVYYGPHDIRVQEVERPTYGPGGALIKVKACGVCNIIDTKAWEEWPEGGRGIGWALGHEWSGEVAEVGPEVTEIKEGDKVYGHGWRPCYQCEACRVGDYWRCINWMHGMGGKHGAFSEYIGFHFVTDHNVAVFPQDMSFRDLAMSEPMELSIGIASKAKPSDVVVVLGQDLVGIGLVACLKERGVAKVITGSISEIRRKAAKEAGADIVLDDLKDNIVQVVMDETRGRGADIAIVIDERPIATQQSMSLIRSSGQVWLTHTFGGYLQLNPAVVSMHPVSFRQVDAGYAEQPIKFDSNLFSMQSAWGTLGPYKPRWLKIVDLARAGKITAEKHVTHVFPLEKIKEAFDIAVDPHQCIKVMIEP